MDKALKLLAENVVILMTVISVPTGFIVELIKQSDVVSKRSLPWISAGVGLVTMLIIGWLLKGDLLVYGIAGIASGLTASGGYDAIESAKGEK